MNAVAFLTNTRGKRSLHWTDWLSYAYLAVGLFLMFGPVLWLVMSSFKTEAALTEFPPTLLALWPEVGGGARRRGPEAVYRVKQADGSVRELAAGAPHRPHGHDGRSRQARRADPRSTSRTANRSANSTSRPRTTPTSSASSASVATCGIRVFITVVATILTLAVQLDGRLRAVEVQVPGPHDRVPADHRHADDAADDHPGADLPGRQRTGAAQQPVGRDPGRRWPRRPACSCCASTC